MNQVLTQSLGLNLSKDRETEGFDLQAGQTWVYPTNYPIRDYQFNIIEKALLKNTLVSLPTGLGKTFIAAVVMYNFFRWYPMGKVVFMAPTRPLVKQQIDACYDITAIPKESTAELTGTKLATSRADIWKEKRVFFITPQILQNDLDTLKELGPRIKCLVFDEGHRARGNHAYCEVIRKLVVQNPFFRVLALSATPGSTISDVLEVVQNLRISHLEFRTEESLDVQPYVYKRNLTTVVVPLGEELQKVRENFLQILEYYTKTLVKYKIIQGNCGNLTKGKIFLTMKEFQRNRTSNSPNYAEIMKSLNICVTLYHAFELLTRHGLRSFLSFFSEHIDKPLLRGNTRLLDIVNGVRDYLGPEPNIEQLPDGSYPEVPKTVKFGHPKFYKLRDILVSHFLEMGDSSRVIVFFEYRNSVIEAYTLLIQARPVLKPRIFLGQGHGITQRLQLNVVKSFREGQCNVLLSTCIGEEGLDVGNVDLIVCFDISNKSPIRMVQRMGRTGRKKEGHIVVLVTEGKEQQILNDCLIHKDNIAFHVLSSKELAKGLTFSSPRLVPANISPKCEKIHITVTKPILTKKGSLKEMFRNASSSSSELSFSPDLELIDIQERIPEPQMLWNTEDPLDKNLRVSNVFGKRTERQRNLQPIHEIAHSGSSKVLVELLQLVDSKKYNISSTQIGGSTQLSLDRNLKQCDIRSMFKSQTANDFELPTSQGSKLIVKQTNTSEENFSTESKELFSEIKNYLSIQMNTNKKCRHCPDNFDCTKYNPNIPNTDISWMQLDDSVFSTITLNDIKSFTESLGSKSKESLDLNISNFDGLNLVTSTQNKQDSIFDGLQITQLEKMAETVSGRGNISMERIEEAIIEKNVDLDIPLGEKACRYEAPKNLDLLISRYGASILDDDEAATTNNINEYEILSFFKLKSLSELFIDKNEDNRSQSLSELFIGKNEEYSSQDTVIYSPDIFEATFAANENENRNFHAKQKSEDDELLLSPVLKSNRPFSRINMPGRPNLQRLKIPNQKDLIESPSKFTMNATKLSSTPFEKEIHQNDDLAINTSPVTSKWQNHEDITDIRCRVGESPKKNENRNEVDGISQLRSNEDNRFSRPILHGSPQKSENHLNDIDVDDICDLSTFGISPIKLSRTTTVSNKAKDKDKVKKRIDNLFGEKTSPRKNFDIDDFCDLSSFGIRSQKDNSNIELKKNAEDEANCFMVPSKTQSESSFGIKRQKDNNIELKKNVENEVDCSMAASKSQSQLPITQLLSLINKDNSTKCTPSQKSIKLVNQENISGHKVTSEIQRSILSLDKTAQSPSRPSTSGTPTKKNLSKLFNQLSPANSDDEFEEKPASPIFKRPRLMLQANRKMLKNSTPPAKRVKKKIVNPFIEAEAELSEDDQVYVSDDEEEDDQSVYDASFIADETHHMDTQTHARYLQSIKSPGNRGKFRIPQRPQMNISNVYSQADRPADDTYLEDSFVVHEEEIETLQHELSELEVLEKKLEEQRNKKRKKSEDDKKPKKRRRIFQLNDDSDFYVNDRQSRGNR